MGRPRIYTDEERKEKERLRQKYRYYSQKDYAEGQRPKKTWKSHHPAYNMFANAKMRAKKNNLPFELDLYDIVIPDTCPLLGIEIKKGIVDYTDNSPTLDRIIPELGYVKSNVWVISMRANRLKQDASVKELEMILEGLKKKLS